MCLSLVSCPGGFYHGKLIFPKDYPFRPPRIIMITPNGRFQTNTRLCLSISDFHPDTWNPAWSAATILTGLLSFMVSWSMNTVVFPCMKELRFQAVGEMTLGVQIVSSAATDPMNYLYCAS